MINELARFPTKSDSVYFANNDCSRYRCVYFTHAEDHLIKLKLYNKIIDQRKL